MSTKIEGVLTKIAAKSGSTNGRAWTAYSIAVDTGSSENWYRLGFEAPKVQEGSYVTFDAHPVEGMQGVFKVVGQITVDKSPRESTKSTKQTNAYAAVDSRQDSIVRQNATTTASRIVSDMLTHGVIQLPKTKNKAYDAYLEYVDLVTDRIFLSNRNPKTAEQIIASGSVPAQEESVAADEASDDDVWGDE